MNSGKLDASTAEVFRDLDAVIRGSWIDSEFSGLLVRARPFGTEKWAVSQRPGGVEVALGTALIRVGLHFDTILPGGHISRKREKRQSVEKIKNRRRTKRRPIRVFPTTRWTLVRGLAGTDNAVQRESLAEFYRAYAPAFKLFIRMRFGEAYDEQGREDIVHEFILNKCIAENLIGSATPELGRLRSLLSVCLSNFVLSDLRRRNRGYAAQFRVSDGLMAAKGSAQRGPEFDYFDLVWAGQVIARAAASLEKMWAGRENRLTWRVFQVSVLRALVESLPEPTSEVIAEILGTSRATAHRHRERAKLAFRSEVREILGEYLNDPAEVDAEICVLSRAIQSAPPEVLRLACATFFVNDES